jgi:MYXO-CTERM domain-containing protein
VLAASGGTDSGAFDDGFCVDGYCCTDACSGQCQACDVKNAEGKCSPVVGGAPHGTRGACVTASADNLCTGRVCDGTKGVTSCLGYVGSEVACGVTACKDGITTYSSQCDGLGNCGPSGKLSTKDCGNYACDSAGKACQTSCNTNADCKNLFVCDLASHTCTSGATCDTKDDHTSIGSDKLVHDCAPYKCNPAGGLCIETCATVNDCTGDNVCSDNGTCAPPPNVPTPSSSACGCRVAGADDTQRAAPIAFGLVFAGLAVRRRRRLQARVAS